jgi:hypothetical protein
MSEAEDGNLRREPEEEDRGERGELEEENRAGRSRSGGGFIRLKRSLPRRKKAIEP